VGVKACTHRFFLAKSWGWVIGFLLMVVRRVSGGHKREKETKCAPLESHGDVFIPLIIIPPGP
jgi:hypothetical protein